MINLKTTGEGIPFVFQHGLGANVGQVEQLVSGIKGIKWVYMDMPGHGNSALAKEAVPSFDFYVDQLVEALNAKGIEKAHFGGISMGAGISINMALRYPEKVKSLFLVRPAWIDEGNPAHLRILSEAAELMSFSDGIEKFQQEVSFQAINKEIPNAGQSLLTIFNPEQQKELPIVLKAMVNDKPYAELTALQKLALPSTVIGNDDDPLHPYDIAETTHQNIPGSVLNKVTSRYVDGTLHQKEITEHIKKHLLHI